VKQPIQVALFDLGGTLFYDDPAAWETIYRQADRALWESLNASGIQATPDALLDGSDGLLPYYYRLRGTGLDEPGAGRVLRALLTRTGQQIPESSLQAALEAMFSITQQNWHLEEDAIPALEALRARGVRLGVVSNGSDEANAHRLLERGRLLPFLELVLTSAAVGRRKPDPSIFRAALAHFGAEAGESVMIGNEYEADIVGANAVGMHTIWITRRIPVPPAVGGIRPDATVGALSEIPKLVE
jgi:HAD superfamily hydrolase (TIGR01662 family)